MWFLNTSTKQLEFYNNESDVDYEYAILSHRWVDEEVSFDEIHLENAKLKRGYRKIEYACNQGSADGWKYIWIDTCCIDKRSSAELSEAINSMFRWYQNARMCYVYLSDFEFDPKSSRKTENSFSESRWWSRGWTLQELIAPYNVWFYDKNWQYYRTKLELVQTIYNITDIDVQVLEKSQLMYTMSVAKRMSWAARRSTSRKEDQAYSLLGIFNVNMPLLYGEGEVKAFYRLQEEIIRTSTFADHSILAWMSWQGPPFLLSYAYEGNPEPEVENYQNLLAPSPYGFRHAQQIISWGLPQSETFTLTSSGLRLNLFAQPTSQGDNDDGSVTAILNCRYNDERMSYIVLWLEKRLRVDEGFMPQFHRPIDDIYDRSHRQFRTGKRLKSITSLEVQGEKTGLTLAREPFIWPPFEDQVHVTIPEDLEVLETFPADAFDSKLAIISLPTPSDELHESAFGYMVLKHLRDQRNQLVLRMNRQLIPGQKPFLGVSVCALSEFERLGKDCFNEEVWSWSADHVYFGPGETRDFILTKDYKVQISARLVLESGELFWSIDLHQMYRQEVDVEDVESN